MATDLRSPPAREHRVSGSVSLLPWLVVIVAGVSAAALAVSFAGGGGEIDLPWAPSLGVRLHLRVDGLAALYGILAAGIGCLVMLYATAYFPRADPRFWGWMALFLGSMVALATVQDLLLLFVLFDLTAICSFFLIAHDPDSQDSRSAALMAMLVTAGTAVALLLAAALLLQDAGTLSIPRLAEETQAGPVLSLVAALVLVATLTKSAQVPLHFWLPRAMAAPTPVSAYLHSAAMVAAGVLVIGRLYPVLEPAAGFKASLLVAGGASIVVGGALSLAATDLKRILAYSTVSQYGYVAVLYGLGGPDGAGGAAFYVVAHAIAKSALFLVAGAVTEATGAHSVDETGGLARRLPWLAAGAGVAAAALAALPLTIGFFKDELLFAAALEAGGAAPVLTVLAAALTVAYIGRFWIAVFAGKRHRGRVERLPRRLVAPVLVLAAAAVVLGVWPDPVSSLAAAAGTVSTGGAVELAPAYHLDARPENLMAVAAVAGGALVLAWPAMWRPVAQATAALGRKAGPTRAYDLVVAGLTRGSAALRDAEERDLRNSIAAVLVPGAALILLAFLAAPTPDGFDRGSPTRADAVLAGVLALVAFSAVAVAATRAHLTLTLTLTVLGYGLAVVYAMLGAPSVALVAVTVETMITVVLVAALARLPRGPDRAVVAPDRRPPLPRGRGARDVVVAVLAGASALAVTWSFLSRAPGRTVVRDEMIARADDAHAPNVVTAILVDFRGLDTMAEITVLALATAGVIGLLGRGRMW